MPNGNNSMAQAVYLAQLFAARNSCNCKACRLLRQASDEMTDQLLSGTSSAGAARRKGKAKTPGLHPTPEDLVNLGGDE